MEKLDVLPVSNTSKENNDESKIEPELLHKHPLQNVWQLWYYKNISNVYEDNLFNITSIDTVEDFWGVYGNIEEANKLAPNCAYYFFKKGIRPMWEDDINKEGGRWMFISTKKNSNACNNYWLEILLCLIGEAFGDYNDYVCGAFVVNKRSCNRIGVWTSKADAKEANLYIGKVIKARTEFHSSITYESHEASKRISYTV